MIAFLIFTILYHISLNAALDPLLKYLPKTLEAEEEHLLSLEEGPSHNSQPMKAADKTASPSTGSEAAGNGFGDGSTAQKGGEPIGAPIEEHPSYEPTKKPNFFSKWLNPSKYQDYATLRRGVPKDFADVSYEPEIERNAYYNPAISSTPPILWIPRDEGGISRQEVAHTSRVIPISDEDASLDEKNKIIWDNEGGRPPIFEEKVYY